MHFFITIIPISWGEDMPVKYRIKNLLTWLMFFFVLLAILFYLQSLNTTAQVNMKLVADHLRFNIKNSNSSLTHSEVLGGIVFINKLSLSDCKMEIINPEKISRSTGHTFKPSAGVLRIIPKVAEEESQSNLTNMTGLQLKSLHVPDNAGIRITKKDNFIIMSITGNETAGSPASVVYGKVWVGNEFSLSGRNIQAPGFDNYSDDDTITISTGELYSNITFQGANIDIVLQMKPGESQVEEPGDFLENFAMNNIDFTVIDQGRDRSTIKRGQIDILSSDLFGKYFHIDRASLEEADLLQIPGNERYSVNDIKAVNDGLQVTMLNRHAREIKVGRGGLPPTSIFPTVLDVVVKEPSNKSVWTAFIFIITYIVFFRKNFLQK